MNVQLKMVNKTQNNESGLSCEYTLTRLPSKQEFVNEIVYKGSENIVKNYLYLETRKIIA